MLRSKFICWNCGIFYKRFLNFQCPNCKVEYFNPWRNIDLKKWCLDMSVALRKLSDAMQKT